MLNRVEELAFKRPETMAPVAQVYRMLNEVGLPKGNEAHFHPETIEVCYVRRGILDWWADTTAYEIHSGDIIVIGPGVPHGSEDSTLQPCEYYTVHLIPELFSAKFRAVLDSHRFGGLYANHTEAGDLVVRIFREHEGRDDFSEETVRCLADLLVTSLCRHDSRQLKPKFSALVEEAQRELLNGGDFRSVEDVAALLNVSTVWLTERFRSETGEAPGKWLQAKKIGEAKRRLTTTRDSITQISLDLGFASTQYFATSFRKQTGMTPSVYRDMRFRTGAAGRETMIQEAPV